LLPSRWMSSATDLSPLATIARTCSTLLIGVRARQVQGFNACSTNEAGCNKCQHHAPRENESCIHLRSFQEADENHNLIMRAQT
jgi:hypothetical protein